MFKNDGIVKLLLSEEKKGGKDIDKTQTGIPQIGATVTEQLLKTWRHLGTVAFRISVSMPTKPAL